MKEIFNDTGYEDELILRNKCTRNFETKSTELSLIINEIDMVFKTAYKGGRWVMMDKNYHRDNIYFLMSVKRFPLAMIRKYLKI